MQDFDNAALPAIPDKDPPRQDAEPGVEPFVPESDEDYDGATITTSYFVAGERNHFDERAPEDIERDRQSAQEQLRLLQDQRQEDDRAARRKAPEDKHVPEMERTFAGRTYHRGIGVKDRGDYMDLRSDPKTKQISMKQAKAAILTGVLEKGWDTIYCYKGNKVDAQTRQAVMAALQELQQPGQPLHGRQINVPSQRMREIEPWRAGSAHAWRYNPVGLFNKFDRAVHNRTDDMQAAAGQAVRGAVSRAVMGVTFRTPEA